MPNSTLLINPNNYYEGIIQLRPKDPLLNFAIKKIKERKDVSISRITELKTGVDIYISSRRFAKALGRKLSKSFKGELKYSKTLHKIDRETGKKLYRVTVLFRLN